MIQKIWLEARWYLIAFVIGGLTSAVFILFFVHENSSQKITKELTQTNFVIEREIQTITQTNFVLEKQAAMMESVFATNETLPIAKQIISNKSAEIVNLKIVTTLKDSQIANLGTIIKAKDKAILDAHSDTLKAVLIIAGAALVTGFVVGKLVK